MFCMTCARAFFYCHNISVIDFISKINIGILLIGCLCVLLFYRM